MFFWLFYVLSSFASVDTSKMKETSNENILFDPDTEEYYDLRENGYIDEVYKGDDSFSLSYIHTQTAQWNVSLNSAEIKGIAGSVGYLYGLIVRL